MAQEWLEDELDISEEDNAYCPECGALMNPGETECPQCGVEYGFYCPECDEEIDPDATICPHCGAELEEGFEDDDEQEQFDDDLDQVADTGELIEWAEFCTNCGEPISPENAECPSCGMDLCPDCGHPLEEDQDVCPGCGAEFSFSCPDCGKDLPAEADVCPYCGYDFEGEEDD